MKIWKDKAGNKITAKEFINRFKEGINNITPIQRLSNESRGTFTTLFGFIVCLVAIIVYREKLLVSWFAYGLILVFVGNIWTTGIKWISLRNQLKFLKNLDSEVEGGTK